MSQLDLMLQPAIRPAVRPPAHPVLTPVSGFFVGLLYLVLVPASGIAAAAALGVEPLTGRSAELVLALLLLPLGLVWSRGTRRFGWYVITGMLVTATVIVGVTAGVVWLMLGTLS